MTPDIVPNLLPWIFHVTYENAMPVPIQISPTDATNLILPAC